MLAADRPRPRILACPILACPTGPARSRSARSRLRREWQAPFGLDVRLTLSPHRMAAVTPPTG